MTSTHTQLNKVCLVTGANSGIGKVTAWRLAEAGAKVLMVCRNRELGEKVRQDIAQFAQSEPELFIADLSDLLEVKRVASEVLASADRLDILVNNAGALTPSRLESAQGYELTFALNHLGYFALTKELLPFMKDTAQVSQQGRIISVASDAHRVADLDFSDLQWQKRRYQSFKVYGTTKLCNILFSHELATQLKAEGSTITSNALHPGVVRTGLVKTIRVSSIF